MAEALTGSFCTQCVDLGHGICRLDTGMIHPELAACYLLGSAGEYAIIETGTHTTVPLLLGLLAARGIAREQVRYVIPTHVHLDHAGGVGGLMQALPAATLLIHPRGARHMIDPTRLRAGVIAVYGQEFFTRVYGDLIPVDASRVQTMADATEATLGTRTLTFFDTPGHARHHFCIHDPESSGIFTGDTFGLAYPALTSARGPFILPTTSPVQFDPAALKKSIKRLLALRPAHMYLTHFGMLDEPTAPGARLLGMVDDFVGLAEQAETEAAVPDREPYLVEALRGYLAMRAREWGVAVDAGTFDAVLGMDITLNAQGIGVWLQSRHRQRA